MSIYQSSALYIDLSAAATTSPWYKVLAPSTNHERGIHGTLTSGDTLTIQMTNEKLEAENNILQTNVATSSYATSPAQTATVFDLTYAGSFRWVRAVKTGTAGVARLVVEC
jgi:hypothetical protein